MDEKMWFFIIWTTMIVFNIIMTWLSFKNNKLLAWGLTAFFILVTYGLWDAGVYVFPG